MIDIMAPLIPEFILNQATADLLKSGIRVAQGARMAPTDLGHVAKLLDIMAPPENAIIADIGCGVGGTAELMRELRPDLRFWMINNNRFQLSHVKVGAPMLTDMHDIPLDDSSVDVAMFCYSLCHSDFKRALVEAARITECGGILYVYDYERTGGDNDLFLRHLYSRALSRECLTELAAECGWNPDIWVNPETDDSLFRDAARNDRIYDAIFRDLRVCAFRMIRQ